MGFLDKYINSKVAVEMAKIQAGNINRLDSRELLNFMNGYTLPSLNADTHDYYNAWKTIAPVNRCVNLISEKINSADVIVYKVINAKRLKESEKEFKKGNLVKAFALKALSIEEVTDHKEINALLEKPNSWMDKSQLFKTMADMYLIGGNCFLYGGITVSNKPKQLVPFAQMEIVVDRDDLFNPIRGYQYIIDGYDFACEPWDMYHMKTANPRMIDLTFQHLYGVSFLSAYLEQMRTIQEGQKQASKQMKNGGVFGILSPKDKEDQLSNNQRDSLAERLKEARASNDEIARILPSSIALSWQSMGLPSSELELREILKLSSGEIYNGFNVPHSYLNGDSSSYNNVSTDVKKLIYDGVTPPAKAISTALTNFVGKPYGDYIIEIDLSTLPEMAVDLKEVAKWAGEQFELGVINRDEARLLMNYDELRTPESTAYEYKKRQLNTSNDTNNNQA